jgi:predicted nucleic acid-binding protein
MDPVLIDTNILIYAYDPRDAAKQRQAIECLDLIMVAGSGVVTAQVLSEFYVVATRKLDPPLSPERAEDQISAFAAQWPVLPVTDAVVLLAAGATRMHHMHFWDAQIWAAARLHGITTVLSEDFDAGSEIEGVRFENPLV